MRKFKVTVYTFDELPEEIQKGVLDKHRDFNVDHGWWDYVYDDFAAICDIFGVELDTKPVRLMGGGIRQEPSIWFSGFYSQGDGACFEGRYRCKADAAEKIREYAPQDEKLHQIADKLAAEWTGVDGSVKIEHHDRYYHARTMDFDFSEWEDSEGNLHDPPSSATETAVDCLRDLADWLYSKLENEHEYLTSDEAIRESLEANNHSFYADGERVDFEIFDEEE